MKIRMLVGGHSTCEYPLQTAKSILLERQRAGDNIMDDVTGQLAKIEFLTEDSSVTVYPAIGGG